MGELVGGAFLCTFFQSLFDRIVSVDIIDFYRGKKQLRLLDRLKTTLLSVEEVLDDAEKKQLRNPAVKRWLEGLKDAAEDAENVLDEISTDALEAKILSAESGATSRKRKRSSLVSVATNFAKKIFGLGDRKEGLEEILEKLEYFAGQKDILGLNTVVRERVWQRSPSTSMVRDSEVYGRKEDMDALKKSVLSDGAKEVSVIPIVGMGGVGKTALAQCLFNDSEVDEGFEVKVWVCVSEEYDVCRVTKTVVEAVTKHACDTTDLNRLQVSLKERLKEKKFLVVLDDVWNENYDDWDVLRRPFQDGAKGSKMIVTTRSEKVAAVMGSSPTHNLKELSIEDCWELFAKHASGNKNFMKDAKLETIGREIAKKCKGLPLAAKTLGGLLRSTLDVGEWERVLESDIWDFTDGESNILPALRVSYYYLPSHLKRCFAYCSMFPKDYVFQKEELVSLWMAESLLGHSKGNKRMEDVGDEYLNDLVSRSFFQRMSNGYKSWFVMHDLIVDLAKFVSGNSFHLVGVESSNEHVINVRHFTYFKSYTDSYKRFNCVLEATRLRTFLPLSRCFDGGISDRLVNDLPLKFKCLRSLSLRGYHNIRQLPDSIGELKHLRYVDLFGTSISELPESVCVLYNLQTLNLSNCDNLKGLPSCMHRLINLRCLRISERCVEMLTHVGNLKNLQILNIFIVGRDSETRICELNELSNLRGSLCIKNLRNVVTAKDASEAKLMDKKYLKDLSLDWGNEETHNTSHEKLVLDNLAPSTTIECLEINRYGGTRLPDWVGDHTYCNIVRVKLLNCKYCTFLPPLGQLPSLESLTIQGFSAMETVDHGFYGNSSSSSMNPFPSLKELLFLSLSNWNEWLPMKKKDVIAFPKLKTLRIDECPRMIGNLPHSFPSLTELSIDGCGLINCSLPTLPVIQTLKLVDCEKLVYQELPPTVQSLSLGRCGNDIVSLSEVLMKMETSLQNLNINHCPFLITLGNLPAPLKRLKIMNCVKLEFPHLHESLKYLDIRSSCDSIQYFPLNSYTNLTTLYIVGMKNLESMSPRDGARQDMPSLSRLEIHSCPKLISFSAGGFSAPKLTVLWIGNCKKLKRWPEKMHTLLPSLEKLEIDGCPEVDSFPETGLPSNLERIIIRNCEKLIASRTNWNLRRLTKLKRFEIRDSSEISCFPEEGLLPTSITSLAIQRLSCLESLDQNGLRRLTSLETLQVIDCANLGKIPVGGLPSSLEVLTITECPLLDSKKLKKQIRECPNDIFLEITMWLRLLPRTDSQSSKRQ